MNVLIEGYMKRQVLLWVVVTVMIVLLSPDIVLAASHTLTDGDLLDIATCTSGDSITVDAGADVTLTGTNTDIRILCY